MYRARVGPRAAVFVANYDTENSKLDDALLFGEDVLLALVDPNLFREDSSEHFPPVRASSQCLNEAKGFLRELCPQSTPEEINILFDLFECEEYNCGDLVWRQGDASLSMKLIASGSLISFIEDGSEAGAAETIYPGSTSELTTLCLIRRRSNGID